MSGRGNTNRNKRNKGRSNKNNYEEDTGNYENTLPKSRIRFKTSRNVRPIGKEGRSRPVGTSSKTRTRHRLESHFPDEEDILNMVGKSEYARRVASESAKLHAEHETLQEMLQALKEKPMNYRIKNLVRINLQRKFYNLMGPMPQRLPQPRMQQRHAPVSHMIPYSAYPTYPNRREELNPAAGAPSVPSGNNDLYQ
jgi:hypothetical protein